MLRGFTPGSSERNSGVLETLVEHFFALLK
jgi:hypothetical protein